MGWREVLEIDVSVAVGAWSDPEELAAVNWGPSPAEGYWEPSDLADSRWGGEFERWEPLTCDVMDLALTQGQRSWSGSVEPGSARIRLQNERGWYTPEVGGGGSIPVRIGRRLRVRVRPKGGSDSSWIPLFQGTIRQIDLTNPPEGASLTDVVVVDHLGDFGPLLLPEVSPEGNGDLPGARVNRILDRAGWPTDLRIVDVGDVPMEPTVLGESALSLLREAETADDGRLYCSASGRIVFRSRSWWEANRNPVIRFLATGDPPPPPDDAIPGLILPTASGASVVSSRSAWVSGVRGIGLLLRNCVNRTPPGSVARIVSSWSDSVGDRVASLYLDSAGFLTFDVEGDGSDPLLSVASTVPIPDGSDFEATVRLDLAAGELSLVVEIDGVPDVPPPTVVPPGWAPNVPPGGDEPLTVVGDAFEGAGQPWSGRIGSLVIGYVTDGAVWTAIDPRDISDVSGIVPDGSSWIDDYGITWTARSGPGGDVVVDIPPLDEICPSDLTFSHTIDDVANYVRVTGDGGAEGAASDVQSIALYGPRTEVISSRIADPDDRQTLAERVLARRKDSRTRILRAEFSPTTWEDLSRLLELTLGEVAEVVYVHPRAGWWLYAQARLIGRTFSLPASAGRIALGFYTDAAIGAGGGGSGEPEPGAMVEY